MDYYKEYQSLAQNIFEYLSSKYNVKKGAYSVKSFSNLAYSLGNSYKRISYYDTDQLINVHKKLRGIESGEVVTSTEIENLEKLFEHFKTLDRNSQKATSSLEIMFKKLSVQSKEAIINENEFDNFKTYLHVERKIEREFEKKLNELILSKGKKILFLIGNVGDGKSHILSYMKKKYEKEIEQKNIKIHNDATETNSPKNTALETMKQILTPFSDDDIDFGNDKLVVAINLGVLTNLKNYLKSNGNFSKVVEFLGESEAFFNVKSISKKESLNFSVVSFMEVNNFEIVDGKIKNSFYRDIMEKIYSKDLKNPFYSAYLEDKKRGMTKIIHDNYEYLLREDIKQAIVYLLVRAEIEYKVILSARTILNFFFDITVDRDENSNTKSFLPYLLFDNRDRSDILKVIGEMDPSGNQTRTIDEYSISLYHATDKLRTVTKLLGEDGKIFYKIFLGFQEKQEKISEFINTFLRLKFLMNYKSKIFNNKNFADYLMLYSKIVSGEKPGEIYDLVYNSFKIWNGESAEQRCVIKNPESNQLKILVEVDLQPHSQAVQGTNIVVSFSSMGIEYKVLIDYKAYELLIKLNKGYFLKDEDIRLATNFNRFVKEIIDKNESLNRTIILETDSMNEYELSSFGDKIKLDRR
ncbi:DNA phosphorothioation-dependent restriction protein DptF [Enterococcus nangangensis]|uniref:DNA phosphorothioation-dependent restriction protein DptF n=1 Tax=Enterococcus nangangensis TaxID=2559926 RepID=UPI0010F86F21|nr:DNA phosphorothioation-dependent restriction protein DptF [Enterococcus nangangensis]